LTTEISLWDVRFNRKAGKEFDKVDRPIQKKIKAYIATHLMMNENPRLFGHALKGNLRDFWRYRIGDYRLICYIDDKKQMIKIMHVGHRKDVYEVMSLALLLDEEN
jgi:mRNA interferase RelE/StbE